MPDTLQLLLVRFAYMAKLQNPVLDLPDLA